jgi:hypothetical protein
MLKGNIWPGHLAPAPEMKGTCRFLTMQGDRRAIAALRHLTKMSKKKRVKTAIMEPWLERIAVDPENDDAQVNIERGAPRMYVYFDAVGNYKSTVICADEQRMTSQSCFSNALLMYVGLFYTCRVGYHPLWAVFMEFLEFALLGAKFNPKEYTGIEIKKFVKKMTQAIAAEGVSENDMNVEG